MTVQHTHAFRLHTNLPLGLPDLAGWTPVLLVRACALCDYAEAFHGSEHAEAGRNRLVSWEVWVGGELHSQSRGPMPWKRVH
jgi:hypothetical protein